MEVPVGVLPHTARPFGGRVVTGALNGTRHGPALAFSVATRHGPALNGVPSVGYAGISEDCLGLTGAKVGPIPTLQLILTEMPNGNSIQQNLTSLRQWHLIRQWLSCRKKMQNG